MDLDSVFAPALIVLDVPARTKAQIIDELAGLMEAHGALADKARYVEAVFTRESQTETAVGLGVAIPHAKTDAVGRTAVALARTAQPVPWDGDSVELVFLLAVPESGAATTHLEILATLAQLLLEDGFRQALLAAPTPQVAYDIIHARLGSAASRGGAAEH